MTVINKNLVLPCVFKATLLSFVVTSLLSQQLLVTVHIWLLAYLFSSFSETGQTKMVMKDNTRRWHSLSRWVFGQGILLKLMTQIIMLGLTSFLISTDDSIETVFLWLKSAEFTFSKLSQYEDPHIDKKRDKKLSLSKNSFNKLSKFLVRHFIQTVAYYGLSLIVMAAMSTVASQSMEIFYNSFKGLVYLAQSLSYTILNQMILSFNKFTNGVVSISYDFEQEDFNYENFPQAYSLKLSAKTQFWIGMVTFMIETLKHFMRI